MQSELTDVLNKLASYQAKREVERFILSVPDLIALDREIERLEHRLLELIGGAGGGVDELGSRSDPMSAEIEEATRELGDRATPSDIMRKLRSYAGRQGSCITESAADGILWRTPAGDNAKLTMQALKKRLARRTLKGR